MLRGEPSALVESGAAWLFFPHGIGHLMGLGVRGAGGPLRERRDTPSPIPTLRINLPLRARLRGHGGAGYLLHTAILQTERRARHRDAVNWGRVDRLLDFGGIRIEDDVLITDGGHES